MRSSSVIIKSRAPITIKKDTLEFNVSSFKTKKDANVEDLLKDALLILADKQNRQTLSQKVKELFDKTQSLPSVQDITEEDIAAEIEAYRRGE